MQALISRRPEEYCWLVPLVGLTALSAAAAFWAGALTGVPTGKVLLGYAGVVWQFVSLFQLFLIVPFLIRAMILRLESPLAELRPFAIERFGCPSSAAATLGPILLMPIVMAAFGTLKQILPLVNNFDWDDVFADLDRTLFLGVQPWELTHSIFGSAFATVILDRLYTAWAPMLIVAVLVFAVSGSRQLRARFFLSFALAWILIGVVGAYVFASAGPCYTQLIGASTASEFTPLMDRLREIHTGPYFIQAVEWQDRLWTAHSTRQYGFALGISAMPSMHNAITFLYFLAAREAARPLRVGTTAFAILILVASVHLGWHYAVDGLAAWAMMWAIWWGVGKYLDSIGYSDRVAAERDRQVEPPAVTAAA